MTKRELFNNALGMIAHDRTISSLASTESENVRCEAFWNAARRSILALYDWRWIAADASLTASATKVNGAYYHAAVTGMLRVINVKSATGTPLTYEVVAGRIRTDAQTVVVRYILDDEDPRNWPPLIQDAVTNELASRIAVPITGNQEIALLLREQAMSLAAEAAAQYADNPPAQRPRRQRRPDNDRRN